MTWQEAIAQRVSRRKYLPNPITTQQGETLQEWIARMNQQENLNCQLILDGAQPFRGITRSYGLLQGVQSYLALVGPTADPDCEEKLGYYGECLVLQATRMGLGTCWVAGSYQKSAVLCALRPGDALNFVVAIGNCEPNRSARENLIQSVTHRKTRSLNAMYTAQQPVPNWFLRGMQAVQRAPSANNKQPARFVYADHAVRAKTDGGKNAVDLGIAKFHFVLGAFSRTDADVLEPLWQWGQDGALRIPKDENIKY